MTNTEELTETIRQEMASGNDVDGYLELLARAIARLEIGISTDDRDKIEIARVEAKQLLDRIAELTVLAESRLEGLQMELASLVRQDSLQKRYRLTPH